MINVVNPGLFTTVQDMGRSGYYHVGFPPSGAMDEYAHIAANLLVENAVNLATLELTYMGGEFEFLESAVVAITGANLSPRLNGGEVPLWESFSVASGDILKFGALRDGARGYLAVHGGVDVPIVMGSRSTYSVCGVGGYCGRSLATHDLLPIGNRRKNEIRVGLRVPDILRPKYQKNQEVRVIVGLCSYRFTEESQKAFLETEWTVMSEANRVGYRYSGIRLNFKERQQPFGAGSNPSNVVDLGYPVGSIQVPDGVEPIAVLKDAITGGGYATIATIISADLNILAQTRSNSTTRFRNVTLEQALKARTEYQQQLVKLSSSLEKV